MVHLKTLHCICNVIWYVIKHGEPVFLVTEIVYWVSFGFSCYLGEREREREREREGDKVMAVH